MAKYDVEQLLTDIVAILKANLNTKILAVSADKGDSIVLKPINANAYVTQSLNMKLMKYDPFVLTGISALESQVSGPGCSHVPTIQIMVIMADNGRADLLSRLLRYQRALLEVIQENFSKIPHASNLSIESLVPVAIEDMNSSAPFRGIGIAVKAAIA